VNVLGIAGVDNAKIERRISAFPADKMSEIESVFETIAWLVSSNGRLAQTDLTLRGQGMARQSRNRRNVASKVARASRPCVSVTGDNFAGTHRRDACATTLPVKSSPNATISGDSTAKARRDGEQFSLSANVGVWPSPTTAMY